MGDSITYGTGTDNPCAPLSPTPVSPACDQAKNYAAVFAKQLNSHYPTTFQNLGISGESLSGVISEELPKLNPNATLITLYIGTNDSANMWAPILHEGANLNDLMMKWQQDYQSAINQIKIKAPKATLVLFNVPNQSFMSFNLNADPYPLVVLNSIGVAMNTFINSFAPTLRVVDTTCDPDSYDSSLLTAGPHPNDQGCVLLANKVFKTITSTPPLLPQVTCNPYLSPSP